jgi:N-acetylated-alpha-linked acidic dipeptidase
VAGDERERAELDKRDDLRLSPLGSGSDYTPFLQHLGIASANLGFYGESEHGSYHTLYDTYEHFTRFQDPGFRYGVALADLAGRATLRLANAPILPIRFAGLVDNLALYVEQVQTLADDARSEARLRANLLEQNAYTLALDPERTLGPPPELPEVPHFNFAPLQNVMGGLDEAALRVDAALDALDGDSIDDAAALNRLLYRSERALTAAEGLPGRDWYRHQIYAPGYYTGYGVKTLPRVREAIEARQYDDVDAQVAATTATLEGLAGHLAEIETQLETLSAP